MHGEEDFGSLVDSKECGHLNQPALRRRKTGHKTDSRSLALVTTHHFTL